jgi:plastocyanin
MKKVIVLMFGVMLVAAACNKTASTVQTPTNENTYQTPTQEQTGAQADADLNLNVGAKTYEVQMTSAGFSPNTLTVKKGDTVKFINNDTANHWPASAPHPTHTDYPAFDPKKAIAPSDSWSFTFDKVGNWKYHDHLNSSKFYGTVTVTE